MIPRRNPTQNTPRRNPPRNGKKHVPDGFYAEFSDSEFDTDGPTDDYDDGYEEEQYKPPKKKSSSHIKNEKKNDFNPYIPPLVSLPPSISNDPKNIKPNRRKRGRPPKKNYDKPKKNDDKHTEPIKDNEISNIPPINVLPINDIPPLKNGNDKPKKNKPMENINILLFLNVYK